MSIELEYITPTEIDEFLDVILDFKKFAAVYLKIKDEYGNIIPFNLNEFQSYILGKGNILENLENNIPVRLNILKCRQTGVTTLFQALVLWESLKQENQKILVLGHEIRSSVNMFEIFERYYNNLPKPLQPALDTRQQGKILKYKNQHNILEVQTAGANIDSQKAGTGRSSTYQYIHATECAFYSDYKTTFQGLLQASKYAKIIVLETTANGFNDYRNDWIDAKEGITDYIPIFLSWVKFKSYTKKFQSEIEKEKLINSLGSNMRYNEYKSEEDQLITIHHCTLEKLNWRRWAIDNLCQSEVIIFHQEYPTTDSEAFLATGRPVFQQTICIKNYNNSETPRIGDLVYVKDGVEFVENPKGYIKLHENIEVKEDEFYVFAAGCDVAEGLEQGDRSVIKVIDRRINKVVLSWVGHIDADLLAEEQLKIQKYLKNKIFFNTEMNNHGLTTISRADRIDVNQYYRQDFQKGIDIQKDELGWKTTSATRPYMINLLAEWIRDELFEDKEKEFWNETITFVKNAKGKMQAEGKDRNPGSKTYDDRIFAEALMIICSLWLPNYYKKKPIVLGRLIEEEYEITETTF